ncbi:MAG: malate synthase A, partial [Solirubrobacteraceae bacterium]
MSEIGSAEEVEVRGRMDDRFVEVLTPGALGFVARLHREFDATRRELLARRETRQAELDAGGSLDFLDTTREIRDGDWTVAPAPQDLQDRRVEITGPTDRKMVINALNSGALGFMADFEDSNSPTWSNMISGQVNVIDAVRGSIEHVSPDGRRYELGE